MPRTMNRRQAIASLAAGMAGVALPRIGHAATPLTMQAAWFNDASYAGYYVALDKGYYADAGIEASYLSGGPEVTDVLGFVGTDLTLGDITLSHMSGLAFAFSAKPGRYRIIAAQYQKPADMIVFPKRNKITKPADLVGRKVCGYATKQRLPEVGVDPARVETAMIMAPYVFEMQTCDAAMTDDLTFPAAAARSGGEVETIRLADFGLRGLDRMVVVPTQVLEEKRDTVVAWLRASRRGWEDNFAEPEAWIQRWKDTWLADMDQGYALDRGEALELQASANALQQEVMESPGGYLSIAPADIEATVAAFNEHAGRAIFRTEDFDTSLLDDV